MPRVMTGKSASTPVELQCRKCHRGGGTLVSVDDEYQHEHCLPPDRYAIPRKLRRSGYRK